MSVSRLELKSWDVIRFEGDLVVVLPPRDDQSADSHKHYIVLARLRSDGSFVPGREVARYKFTTETVEFIDGASVEIRVQFPDNLKVQMARLEAEKQERFDEQTKTAERLKHPSFGAIELRRCSGDTQLFMSPFTHQHFISIRIARASRHRSMSETRHFAEEELIEVMLSEAQFAAFITSGGFGDGVPCTLSSVIGSKMPEAPADDERFKFQQEVERDAKQATAFLTEAMTLITVLLNKPSVSKKDRQELFALVNSARRQLDENMPFIIRQLQERMEHVVSAAGTEVEAYVQRTLQRVGFEAATGKMPIQFAVGIDTPLDVK